MRGAPTNATLVPGAAGLANFWQPTMRHLPSDWDKQAIDLPGFGPVPPAEGVESYDALVDRVASQISRPGLLFGQSMGAYVCLKLALGYPDRVTHLVLSVAAAGVDMQAAGARDWRPRHRTAHDGSDSWIYESTDDLTASLAAIRVPVLLVWAERDPLSPLDVARQLERALPHARLLTFDTDDHWLMRRFAARVGPEVVSFVRDG